MSDTPPAPDSRDRFDAQPERARRQPGDLLLPDHSKTLPELTLPALEQVVATAGANR